MAPNGTTYKQKDKSEKSIQREKDSRLLAEKTSELAGKQLACVEQKNKNLENQLKKAETKAKDAEVKVKDEARKRIVAELELVDQQKKFNEISDKFVKQTAVLNEEKNDLAKAVNGLVKEVLDDKVSKARDAATERLQDFVNEETGKKILEDSEEIVKQSFLKAMNRNEDFDCYDDVKKIFSMVKDVVRSPENINQELLKSPVKFDVQKVKTEMKEYLKNRNEVTEQSFEIIFDGLVQEGLRKNDRIVNIESDDEEQNDIVKDDRTVLLDDDVILDELKDVHEIEISKLLTWMPDDLEEEDVTRSVTEESLEVPVADNAQTEDTTDFTIQRMSCELPTDRSEEMDGTNDEPDEEINKVHVKSMLNRIVGTDSRTYLDEAGTPWTPVRPEADVEAAGSPEKHHKETQKNKRLTSLIEEEVRALPGSHFLGYHSGKTTSSKLYSWGELGTGSAASTTVRNDSGHVQEIKPISTLHIPEVSTRPGVEMREHQRQGCLPQLRRQAITGTRTSSSHAAGQEQSLLHVGLSWSEGPAWPFIAKSSVKVTSSPDTGRLASMKVTSSPNTGMWASMTVPFSPDTGRLASMTVTSSTDTGIWACMLNTFTMTVNMNHYCTIGHVDCVIQPLLVTHSMGLLSQHGQSPHGHLILTGYQQHRDALEDGVHSRYSALTGQEDTHTVQEQRQHHHSLSQLIIYKASFGKDLEQHLAVNLLGNDQEASKYQVQQQDGLGHSHPHHQQGDGQVHHAHLLQHCSPEPVPEHHASRPVLSIRISVLSLQKLNNMQNKSCRMSIASAEESRVGLQKPTVALDGHKHHLLLALHDGHHHLAQMKQELLSQCCTQQASSNLYLKLQCLAIILQGLSTCMMWPNYTLSTLTTTSMVMCYMTSKGADKLALVRESKKETHKVEVAEIDVTVSNGACAVILKLYNMQVDSYIDVHKSQEIQSRTTCRKFYVC